MGCDIHAYIEFAQKPAGDDRPYWQSFTRNGGGRNYVMFGVLAGVRVPEAQLFEPKGMPEGQLSSGVSGDHWILVAPEVHPEWADDEGYCSLANAEAWVKNGYSVGENDENRRLRRVSNPDHHSHSWLTADELQQALDHYGKVIPTFWSSDHEVPAEWQEMFGAMRSFEAADCLTRLVFWFDN
ncbi:hypothetical protein [Sphingomonas sp.]|uniref:hypothetical protein n=1 Tax=Sphingomonas sp. TaxID=28214 RepID=UPI002FD8C66B